MTLQSRGKQNEDDYVVDWSPSDMVEIRFKEDDDFLKIKETLTRMGVASNRDKILYQSKYSTLSITVLHLGHNLFLFKYSFKHFLHAIK